MSQDGWMWQGRQGHGWFGHGTKPPDASPVGSGRSSGGGYGAVRAMLDERIRALGHAAMAGLPASKRYHSAATFDGSALERLVGAMRAWVGGLRLDEASFAARFFDASPNVPAVKHLRRAAELVAGANTSAGLRAATDELAAGMLAVGLDRWPRFLKDAHDRVQAQAARGAENGAANTPGSVAPDDHTSMSVEGGYSPAREGYHRYQAGPNIVCPARLQCTAEEVADQMSRFAVPGQSPHEPVRSGQRYPVYDPVFGAFIGHVVTRVSPDGLTTQNVTRPGHLLHDGQITRTAVQNPDGSWSVTTIGVGNNIWPVMPTANEVVGPDIFNIIDGRMRRNIELHHGAR